MSQVQAIIPIPEFVATASGVISSQAAERYQMRG